MIHSSGPEVWFGDDEWFSLKKKRWEITAEGRFMEFTCTCMSNFHIWNHLINIINKQSPGRFSLTYSVSERTILRWRANISLARTVLFQEIDVKCTEMTGDTGTWAASNETSLWFLKSANWMSTAVKDSAVCDHIHFTKVTVVTRYFQEQKDRERRSTYCP